MKLKQLLKKDLTKKQLEIMPSSFDTVGDICLFNQFPDELKSKEKKIAKVILKQFPNFKVVAKKTGKYNGIYRTPIIRILGGERRKETIHKENNIRLKLHIEKCYFSARTSTERQRITDLVKPGERILVMFSGIAPLPINISKHTLAKEIIGVEINPFANKYAEENLVLNKIKNVTLYGGDVNKVVPMLSGKFDRILMPLPKNAELFLPLALNKIRRGGTIHIYSFLHEPDVANFKKSLKAICKEKKKTCKILRAVKCGQFSPGEFRRCFDLKIT